MAFYSNHKKGLLIVFGAALLIGLIMMLGGGEDDVSKEGHKNASYEVDGKIIRLVDGAAESSAAPGSASKIITEYFGNDVKGDFDKDGREDVAFIFTQQSGGSGTFYYAVAALAVDGGYHGTNAVLLGDRIAPQSTEFKNGEIIVNYADREGGQAMSEAPTVGVSKYLKVDNGRLDEVIRLPDLAGGSGIVGVVMMGPNCPVIQNPPVPECADRPYAASLEVTSPDGREIVKTFSSLSDGKFAVALPPGQYALRSHSGASPFPTCSSNGLIVVAAGSFTDVGVSCDTGIR